MVIIESHFAKLLAEQFKNDMENWYMKPKGKKYDTDKLRFDLIPIHPLRELANVYTIGANKYDDRNWELGINYSRLYAALQRHVTAFWNGEDFDQEDGQHHLASVVWCAFAIMEFQYRNREDLDDRQN